MKVLRMSLPIVENLSGPQESIFNLFRGPQLNSRKKSKKQMSNFIKCIDFPPFPLFGVPWAAVLITWGQALPIQLSPLPRYAKNRYAENQTCKNKYQVL